MKLILQFIRPHWKLCVATVILLIVDVAGALFIPTLAAQMLNQGTSGASFDALLATGIQMAAASVLSGVCAILGGLCLRHFVGPGGQGYAGGPL